MQSEEFDNKIKEAADHHHPAYDEKAWNNMEKLLDKHLPQEKDNRRRIIFFLFFFLLLGGGAWLLISKHRKENKQVAQAEQSAAPVHSSSSVQQTIPDKNNEPVVSDKQTEEPTTGIDIINKEEKDNNNSTPVTPVQVTDKNVVPKILAKQQQTIITTAITISGSNKKRPEQTITDNGKKKKPDKSIVINSKQDKTTADPVKNNTTSLVADIDNKTSQDKSTVVPLKDNTAKVFSAINPVNKKEQAAAGNDNQTANTDQKTNEPDNNGTANKDTISAIQKSVNKKIKAKANKSNSFFITLSAGPDISFTGGGSAGKMKLLAGAGLGYTFKDRLTIRTGFYTSRKIYSALPGDYHPPADFQLYYPYLEKVDADCKVYEIPLSVSYYFGNTSNQNWFASAGVSSYLMKKETYDYTYKNTPTGQSWTKQWTLLNVNKHYFSVLTLSAGYQRHVSKRVSLTAEPYFKLPISGVGYGKVKLNSAGLLFSIGIKPFNASSKKNIMKR